MNYLRSIIYPGIPSLPDVLSADDRRYGRSQYFRWAVFNGISVACLLDNMLILFAIRNHLSDPQIAVMVSFIYLTMPLMVAGKRMAARIGVVRTWALGWFYRYLSACLIVIAPFFHSIAPQWVVTGLIMIGAFGFAFFRTIGLVAQKPLAGEITTEAERGRFLSGNSMRVHISHFITMLLIVLWLNYSNRLWVYQAILAIGCLTGFYATTIIARIPESAVPRLSARRSLTDTFARLWVDPRQRQLLFCWCAGFASFSLVPPIMVVALKNGYLISDHAAFFFSSLFMVGAIAVSMISTRIADRINSRLLLQFYMGGLILAAAYWAFAPSRFSPVIVAATFVIAGGCKAGILIALSHYFLDVVDESRRVGSSLVVQIFAGGIAGLSGVGISGGLLKFLATVDLRGMHMYRAYFQIILLILLAIYLVSSRRNGQMKRMAPINLPGS